MKSAKRRIAAKCSLRYKCSLIKIIEKRYRYFFFFFFFFYQNDYLLKLALSTLLQLTVKVFVEIYRRSFGEIKRFARFANAVVNDLRDRDLFKWNLSIFFKQRNQQREQRAITNQMATRMQSIHSDTSIL